MFLNSRIRNQDKKHLRYKSLLLPIFPKFHQYMAATKPVFQILIEMSQRILHPINLILQQSFSLFFDNNNSMDHLYVNSLVVNHEMKILIFLIFLDSSKSSIFCPHKQICNENCHDMWIKILHRVYFSISLFPQ